MSNSILARSWPVVTSLVVVGAICLSGGAAPVQEADYAGKPRISATEPDRLARLRIDTPDGSLLFFEASVTGKVVESPDRFLAWWRDEQTSRIYLFSTTILSFSDARTVAAALSSELGVTMALPAGWQEISGVAVAIPDDDVPPVGQWLPADRELVFDVLGHDGPLPPEPDGPSPIKIPCQIPLPAALMSGPGHLDRVLHRLPVPTSPDEAIDLVGMAMGCGGGGPGDPPNPDCPNDKDCDGIPNGSDPDVDGDGIPNGEDGDVDGDGIPNGEDDDTDGDGIPNGSDPDVDGDGIPNGGDNDIDGDGIPNGSDDDADGDGIPNDDDGDDDGDGVSDPEDPEPGGCSSPNCLGACCNTTNGSCTLKKPNDCTATHEHFNGEGKSCHPNPCCVMTPNPIFNPTHAWITEVPRTWEFDPNGYGATAVEGIFPADIQVSASCDGQQWCAILTGLVGRFSVDARLLPGQQEVTGPFGNTTSENHCTQVKSDLDGLGKSSLTQWYMIEAVWSHEYVHVSRLEPALETVASAIEADIESICVAHVPGKTRNDAIMEIRGSTAFSDSADRAGFDLWEPKFDEPTANDHAPGGPTDQAEHLIVDPMINAICTYSDSLCWPYCSQCPARPTGACCAPDTGVCNVKTSCDCEFDGGIYRGSDTTCGPPNPCVGACCFPDHSCTEATQSRCTIIFGGQYQGDATVCGSGTCTPPG